MEPEVNHAVLEYAQQHVGQKAGAKGTCWDLAEEALKVSHGKTSSTLTAGKAFSKGDYIWGKQFYDIRELQPGDIIQFRNHVNKITTATAWTSHKRPHHTAIVESVGPGAGEITVLEQHVQAGPDDPNKKLEVVRRNKMYLQSGSFAGVGSVTVTGTALFFHPTNQ